MALAAPAAPMASAPVAVRVPQLGNLAQLRAIPAPGVKHAHTVGEPTQELLNAGTILEAGKEYEVAGGRKVTRPETDIVHACVKFFDHRQFKVAQTYGTVDDAAALCQRT
ncbi:uncharacterized protein F4817DRAFT_313719 [Daldinia loculata]|uniref:uncharacterized protein n=1 Tax=Daldinia loculata TaxID=103429 RepID=UPI0020C37767|nr:uncharacterized protein F4817DRAFT_313719 [Daldinia loculata]KAI1649577.1 hypothetical protein F4817DRAFT_313719 [Daldinia loculata]